VSWVGRSRNLLSRFSAGVGFFIFPLSSAASAAPLRLLLLLLLLLLHSKMDS
jgi:hypothetical protein